MWKKNTLIDNAPDHTLADCLRRLVPNGYREFCTATGYWDIPGTALLLPELNNFLDNGGKIRMIIGQEPTVREYQIAPERV